MHNRDHAVISCLFGSRFKDVYPAIEGVNSIFFTNNELIRREIESKGWTYRFVEAHPISDSYRISSQQSKYIKYLQFVKDFPEFSGLRCITYVDHKFFLKETHLTWIKENKSPSKSILIRTTPACKTSISDEIIAAMPQERYSENMAATIEWVEKMKREKCISEYVRIVNTGLIDYSNLDLIFPLLNAVYSAVWDLRQPECQIIWAVLAQEYDNAIQKVAWEDLCPLWAEP